MFALNLGPMGRILSACVVLPATPETMPRVETLPEGHLPDYRYESGEYVFDPIPEPEPPEPEPTDQDRLEAQVVYTAMMTDTLLEG
jgi:hypothetical protein